MKTEYHPKISIITPSFNQGQYIEQTILSVIEQGYPNLEYILIDGGSTDNTIDIIKKYERYITYWVSEKDKGQSSAINKGMKLATGEVVNWLNSDDFYMPGALYHIAEQFKDPKVSVYCGRSRVFSNHSEYLSQGTDIYEGNWAKTIGWARIDQPETFFRKEVWNTIGLLNEDFHYVMDKELWIRYLFRFGLSGVEKDDRVIVNFRIHEGSKTGSQKDRFTKETFDLFYSLAVLNSNQLAERINGITISKVKDLFGYEGIDKQLLDRVLHYFILKVVLESYAESDFKKAKAAALLLNRDNILSDVGELEKVLFRMSVAPKFMKQAVNYFTNVLRNK